MIDTALAAFVTLFVIVDPIGLAPLFVVLTQGASNAERRRIALRAVGTAAVMLTLFGLLGETVLDLIGVSMPAFRISGGLMLFLIAVEMLFEQRSQRRAKTVMKSENAPNEENSVGLEHDPSVFPLATPLLAGPGAMATMVLLVGQQEGDPLGQIVMFGVLFAALGVVLACLLLARHMEKLLGKTGVLVVTRLFGMLLGAMSVQFVLDGMTDYGILG